LPKSSLNHAAHRQTVRLEAHAARAVDEVAGGLLELGRERPAAERRGSQIWTAERRAIDGVVDERIAPVASEYAVLDIVQAERRALDRDDGLVPGAAAEPDRQKADPANARHRIVPKHKPQRRRVVDVGPECELLRPVKAADGHPRAGGEIALERGDVGRFEFAIGDARRAVRCRPDVAREKTGKRRMVNRCVIGRIVLLPPPPALRAAGKQALLEQRFLPV